jgi:hypothetical protein
MLLVLLPAACIVLIAVYATLSYRMYTRHRQHLHLLPLFLAAPIVAVWALDIRSMFPSQPSSADHEFRLGDPFSGGMVLQCEPLRAHIWGMAPSRANVSVGIERAGMTRWFNTSADAEGNWLIRTSPLSPGHASLHAISGASHLVVSPVFLGSVFFCGMPSGT